MGDGSGNSADLKALVVPFYTEFMTADPQVDVDEIVERMERLISDDLGSASNVDGEPTGKQKLLATGRAFVKLMPDFTQSDAGPLSPLRRGGVLAHLHRRFDRRAVCADRLAQPALCRPPGP